MQPKGVAMPSKVYYIKVSEADSRDIIKQKFVRLISASDILSPVSAGDNAVVKIHFGEEGNTGFVNPGYVNILTGALKDIGATPVLSDTNTLYKGRRMDSESHLKLAHEHGFTTDECGAEVIIPDESVDGSTRAVDIGQEFIKTAKVTSLYLDADILVNVAHFKGHMMTGFGGVLKNIGMGCAAREGKLEQHTDISPAVFTEACIGCGKCRDICPVNAISLTDNIAFVNSDKCIGCADCMAVCPTGAVTVDWVAGGDTIQEKMTEYAKAVLDRHGNRTIHINFALKITKECDCLAKDDPRIAPDIGIFVSRDPVSLDKACMDETIEAAGKDVFAEAHPLRNGMKQLVHASQIGLGSLEYDLIEVS